MAVSKKITIALICALFWPVFLAQEELVHIAPDDQPPLDSSITQPEHRMISENQQVPAMSKEMEEAGTIMVENESTGKIIRNPPSPASAKESTMMKRMLDFKEEPKRQQVIDLVNRGAEFIQNNSLDTMGRVFTHTKQFVEGELYLFVLDIQGNVLAHGQESQLLWHNLYDYKDSLGVLAIQELIKKAKNGGGWVTYTWRNASHVSYVKLVTKNDKSYVIGSGYYPHSKEDAVVRLVKSAVHLCNYLTQQKRDLNTAFGEINYPLGRFVDGDLYLYALDFKGNIFAQGDRPGLVGANSWNYKDERGKMVNQEIAHALEKTNEGVWIEYYSKNAFKRSYAEKVTDYNGVSYFIACGYYPDADRNAAVDLVRKGYQYVKGQGKTIAAREFTSRRTDEYRYGDLYLALYDLKGVCLADGDNEEQVGMNLFDLKDQDGQYYMRALIKKAEDGGGWIDAKLNNSFESIYVEKIDLGIESLVICSGVYPVSKRETMMLLTKSAAGYLNSNGLCPALAEITQENGKFIRGDLEIFLFDKKGICYAYGDSTDLIWQNLFTIKDDDGRQFVKLFINTAEKGAAFVRLKLNGQPALAYIEPIEKDGMPYVIGSLFYL